MVIDKNLLDKVSGDGRGTGQWHLKLNPSEFSAGIRGRKMTGDRYLSEFIAK